MARKIGDFLIGIIILAFVVSGLSLFMNAADSTLGVSTGVASGLTEIDDVTGDASGIETSFTGLTDSVSDFSTEEDQLIDDSGKPSGGLLNLLSKNILTQLNSVLSEKLDIDPIISGLGLALLAVTGSILLLRSILGETKW